MGDPDCHFMLFGFQPSRKMNRCATFQTCDERFNYGDGDPSVYRKGDANSSDGEFDAGGEDVASDVGLDVDVVKEVVQRSDHAITSSASVSDNKVADDSDYSVSDDKVAGDSDYATPSPIPSITRIQEVDED